MRALGIQRVAGKRQNGNATPRTVFAKLLAEVKGRIQEAQTRAVVAVNSELVRLYWDIGRMIAGRQRREGWGAAVIPRLAKELKNELPQLQGFSERNIKRMLAFYREYPDALTIVQEALARLPGPKKVPQPVAQARSAQKVPQPVALIQDSPLWSVPWASSDYFGYQSTTLPGASELTAISAGVGRYTLAMNGGLCSARKAAIFGAVATKCLASTG